ncbi:MAG: hypothetical protein ACK5AL_09155 [Planctomycetota bacterium]|jgi:hypothetical protein
MTTSPELTQALEQLARMYRVLAGLRASVLPKSAQQFSLMAEGPMDEIRRLESTVYELSGRPLAEAAEAQIWLRIQGKGAAWPEASTSILTSFLDTLRKGVQAATECIFTSTLSTRPTKALKQACDLQIATLQAGSVQVGLRLPDPPRGEARDENLLSATEKGLTTYLQVAAWASSDSAEEALATAVPDVGLRRTLLAEVKRLAPRPRGDVDVVELSGRAMRGGRATLTKATHDRINRAIDHDTASRTEQHIGELREIDLDNLTFTLRNVLTQDGTFEVACKFDQELLPSAMEALDRRVEIAGERPTSLTRGRSVPLRVTRLVILDDEDRAQ